MHLPNLAVHRVVGLELGERRSGMDSKNRLCVVGRLPAHGGAAWLDEGEKSSGEAPTEKGHDGVAQAHHKKLLTCSVLITVGTETLEHAEQAQQRPPVAAMGRSE